MMWTRTSDGGVPLGINLTSLSFPTDGKVVIIQRWKRGESKYIQRYDLGSMTTTNTKTLRLESCILVSLLPAFFASSWMIKEGKFFLQELIEVQRRNFLVQRQVVHSSSIIKLWSNALSSSSFLQISFIFFHKAKQEIGSSLRVICRTQESL